MRDGMVDAPVDAASVDAATDAGLCSDGQYVCCLSAKHPCCDQPDAPACAACWVDFVCIA